ncbi:MAG: sodium:proton antiporter, partial [Flavobacteriales bacterium]
MTTTIIITICVLLLLAYVFDISSALTKIPSVILLLLLGWLVKQTVDLLNINIPNLNPLLPILGTIGLILIVLEGSLELELN